MDELEKQTEHTLMLSSVYKTLVDLEEKGYLKSHLGAPLKRAEEEITAL